MVSLDGGAARGNMVVQNAMEFVHQSPTGSSRKFQIVRGTETTSVSGIPGVPYKPDRNGRHGHLFVTGLGGSYNSNLEHHCSVKGGAPLCAICRMDGLRFFAKKVVPGDPRCRMPCGFPQRCFQICESGLVRLFFAAATHDGPCSCMSDPLPYSISIVPWLTFPVFAVLYNSRGGTSLMPGLPNGGFSDW